MQFLPPLPRVPGPRRIAAWYREQKLEEARLLPPVPTPTTVAATLKESPGTRRTFLWLLLLLALGVGFYFAWPRAWGRIKAMRARQLAAQALVLISHQEWNGANEKITSAFHLNPMQPAVWRAYARLLSRNGRGGAAVEWWSKIEHVRPLTLEDRRDYLAAAISANEIGFAETQLRQIIASEPALKPIDHFLASQLALLRGNNTGALSEAAKVLNDASATRQDVLTGNLLILAATARDSDRYVAACSRLVEIARSAPDDVSLEALVVLAKQLAARPPGGDRTALLAIPMPELSSDNIPAMEIAERLEHHPAANAYQKTLALEMRARAEPEAERKLIEQALHSYGGGDDQTIAALGAWLSSRGHFEEVLGLLPIERASQTRELLLERIDSLAGAKRFRELKEMLLTEYPVLPQSFQHMYLAVVYADLHEMTSSNDEWQRALDAADNVDRLLALADFAQKNNRPEIVSEALARAILRQPGLRSAYVRRLRVLEIVGPAAEAHRLTREMIHLWPNDLETQLHEIYLRLLLGDVDAALIEKEAEETARKLPPSGLSRSTVALARLNAHHPAGALQVLGDANIDVPPRNVSLTVYAAALAANGWKDKAQEQAERLATIRMLPEERALIAPLLNAGR